MTDRKGNRIDTSDTFTFDPPKYPNEPDCYPELRGRQVRIAKVVTPATYRLDGTYGPATVKLSSCDPVARQYLRATKSFYPTDWLTLID